MTTPDFNPAEAEFVEEGSRPVIRLRPTLIYALIDPRTNEIRYIGKTNQKLNIRYTSHMRDVRPSRKLNWLISLKNAGLKPRIEIIEKLNEGSVLSDWQDAERFWISYLRSIGVSLTNLTIGGEGIHGFTRTSEHKKKIGDAHRGRKRSQETRARIAESRKLISNDHLRILAINQRGTKLTPEHRAKIAAAGIGRRHSKETIERMSKAALGRKCSAETRENMSRAQKMRSPEHQEKMTESKRGKPLSPEHCAKLSEAQKIRYAKLKANNQYAAC